MRRLAGETLGWIGVVVAAVSTAPGTGVACAFFVWWTDMTWERSFLLGIPFCFAWYWGGYFASGMSGVAADLVLHGRQQRRWRQVFFARDPAKGL